MHYEYKYKLPELTPKDIVFIVYFTFSIVVISMLIIVIRASPECTASASDFFEKFWDEDLKTK